MYIFEVYLNDEKICDAGDENIKNMQSSFFLLKEKDLIQVEFKTQGLISNTDGSFQNVGWTDKLLQVGDEVKIKLIEGEHADNYETKTKFGTVFHSTSLKEKHCSFCGRLEDEVGNMVEGFGGNICKDCILVSYQQLKPEK